MKNLLLTAACLGLAFSGFATNARADGAPGGVIGRHRLVASYLPTGQEIPQKPSRAVIVPSAHGSVVI